MQQRVLHRHHYSISIGNYVIVTLLQVFALLKIVSETRLLKMNGYQLLCLLPVLLIIGGFTPVPLHADAYCWQAGHNPAFTGPPKVEQVDIRHVKVSWFGLVSMRECADQFLVKFWPKNNPQGWELTEMLPNDSNEVVIGVVPKVDYTFQAIAREDKGAIIGVDYNKSPQTDFKTSVYNAEVKPSPQVPHEVPEAPAGRQPENVWPQDETNKQQILPKSEEEGILLGLSLELLAIIVVCSVVLLLIVVGLIYKLACSKKTDDEDDYDEDDDDDNDGEKEKLEA